MGSDPIQVKILSSTPMSNGNGGGHDSKTKSGNSSPLERGFVNYQDENYSIDLPVFSIHGNHDDPSRDGGNSEMYAALDLLDVANLVNYFGKQEDTKNIKINPVLMQKGSTKVALYGLGSMRDERLNRMWRGKDGSSLSFTKPQQGDGDEKKWFNIFALHQNRDYGRGSSNCVKEDMIPDWMDFVCWGHEHECNIEVQESVVGTFVGILL
jgi:double-strand break repair protein MRE11